MDYFHSVTATSTVAIIAFPLLFLFSFLWISRGNTNSKKTAPEAGGAWPIIGHLRLLGGPQPPHISLANMADKYGRIFTIKLGVQRALVVSNWEVAKECLTINDKAFATRPNLACAELMGYHKAMIGFAPYGPHWRQMRKFTTIELLSNHRLNLLKHVRESEKKSSNSDKVLVEMKRWFRDVTLNVILRIVLMKKVAKDLDQVAEEWLREHKEKRAENVANSEEDFMGVLLSILSDTEEHEADTINKATSLNLILAAEDTLSITMTWALSLLLNNRDALNKVKQELDIYVGKDKLLLIESDTKNFVYLQSVIKETLQLYPAAPLSVTHEAIEDCSVSGYHVSADPLEFRPERFITTHKDIVVRGYDFELIPFSSGRRMCPGYLFALKILELTLANVLHWFEFETPSCEIVDMRESPGLTNPKATPLEVHITPRLPTFVYQSTN
ncbi:hypothetical protein E1A91_A06G014800v1 [Gossypium mustelinum]|uniref:Cytochrome P450 n=1 Tax=Gossypium mustelinum TaxID=34275 RepID=A0A5D2YQJ2_GOSMU|nr:hypothetical protein E1A91_A06G014800v1 [Gossypium mustelinum]